MLHTDFIITGTPALCCGQYSSSINFSFHNPKCGILKVTWGLIFVNNFQFFQLENTFERVDVIIAQPLETSLLVEILRIKFNIKTARNTFFFVESKFNYTIDGIKFNLCGGIMQRFCFLSKHFNEPI